MLGRYKVRAAFPADTRALMSKSAIPRADIGKIYSHHIFFWGLLGPSQPKKNCAIFFPSPLRRLMGPSHPPLALLSQRREQRWLQAESGAAC